MTYKYQRKGSSANQNKLFRLTDAKVQTSYIMPKYRKRKVHPLYICKQLHGQQQNYFKENIFG